MTTYDTLASAESIAATQKMLTNNGFLPEVVETGADALARIKEIIPAGASLMNGSSRTLDQIGFIALLKEGKHGWNNLHDAVLAEQDKAKQAVLRKQSVISDYYLGSVHALSETGEMIIASASGSQLPHIVFTSPNIIFVVSTQKITPTVDAGLARLREHVFPLEDQRMKDANMGGSMMAKTLILSKEPAFMGRKVHVILVKEKLGF